MKQNEAKFYIIKDKTDFEKNIFNPNKNLDLSHVYGSFCNKRPNIAFIFCGQGPQFFEMGFGGRKIRQVMLPYYGVHQETCILARQGLHATQAVKLAEQDASLTLLRQLGLTSFVTGTNTRICQPGEENTGRGLVKSE